MKLIPLGGAGTVTKNMFVYEYGEDILLVDCGIGFPEEEQLGVDVVIPDVSFLRGKVARIRGIIITHGHEDHFGALPYLLPELGKPPIFASKLVLGFIRNKLSEFNLLSGQSLNLIEPETDPFELGVFKIIPFRVNHSVPDSLGFSIETPAGQIIHAADFKFDWTPVDGRQFEISKLAKLSEKGVLCLLSDCLGSTSPGYTESERLIEQTFEQAIAQAQGQVFITTVSSNISRMQQAVNASLKFNRRLALLGRSIEQNVAVARSLGYLEFPENALISPNEARRLPVQALTYLIAGCYGQPDSALARLAVGENEVELKKGALVVFSADPIPGTEDRVYRLIDKLIALGAVVIYSEIQGGLHVSGHGSRGDLAMMIGITKPSYFIPIGGTLRHMREYARLAAEMGFDPRAVLELKEGEIAEFHRGKAAISGSIKTSDIFVDGSRIGDIGTKVLEDRRRLSSEGIFVVILRKGESGRFRETVSVVSRGFVYMARSEDLIRQAERLTLQEIRGRSVSEWGSIRPRLEERLAKFLYKQTSREPMILSVLLEE